jgi:hypothetical protein
MVVFSYDSNWLFTSSNFFITTQRILKMNYFNTRYDALKAFPNAIVRKIKILANAGEYVVFNDWSTYSEWRQSGYVK